MSSIDGKSDSEIVKEVLDKINSQLKFPLIFKTDEGCRGDGVYLIESPEELKALIYDLLIESSKMNDSEFKSGFLLQEFIGSHNDKAISNYYRINLVNGQPQSAVQLQLQWKKFTNRPYQKLFDFDEAEDKPVPLESFPTEQLKKIANACPYKNGE